MKHISRESVKREVVLWKNRGAKEQAEIVATLFSKQVVILPITAYNLRLMRVLRTRLNRRGVSVYCQTDLHDNVFQIWAKVLYRPTYYYHKQKGTLTR